MATYPTLSVGDTEESPPRLKWRVAGTFKMASTGRSITLQLDPRNSVFNAKYSIPLAHIENVKNGKRQNGCVYELVPEDSNYPQFEPETDDE